MEHIKINIDDIKRHVAAQNGRVRETEKQISSIKGIGGTLVFVIGSILTWLGLEK